MSAVETEPDVGVGDSLRGRTIIVTGASSGIGRGVADHLARAGAQLVLVGRANDRLEASADAARVIGGACCTVAADLTDDAAPEAIVRAAVERFGRIDGLVHTAGVFHVEAFDSAGPEVLDHQYQVNVRAPYALTHAALEHLTESASVVFISSNLAQVGMAQAAAYCASKGAVDAMVRALAVELAPRGVRVNAIAPGIVRTPMTHRLDEDPAEEAAALARTPIGRLGLPHDIAPAVEFALSGASAYMTGSVIVIDGGWNAS